MPALTVFYCGLTGEDFEEMPAGELREYLTFFNDEMTRRKAEADKAEREAGRARG